MLDISSAWHARKGSISFPLSHQFAVNLALLTPLQYLFCSFVKYCSARNLDCERPVMASRMAQRVAKAEIIHLSHRLQALQQQFPEEDYSVHFVAGSITLRTLAQFGRKLNHTSGFGMFGPITAEDLESVERVYGATGLPPVLDMCEFADPSAFELLADRYEITGSICHYQRSLVDVEPSKSSTTPCQVEVFESADHDTAFFQASVVGFRSGGRDPELLKILAANAVARSDTRLFFATVDGELVGTAGMAVFDVDGCKMANLYVDSTLPASRGKGVHRALLLARLKEAKKSGCEMALAAARQGSGSARNIEKAGFEKAYSCSIFMKRC